MSAIRDFFWMCSGSSVSLLKKSPAESNKYVGIGATIFFTGVLATLAGGYALYTIFGSLLPAIVFGIIWGLMIFNLDRYIVSSMKKNGSGWNQFKLAIPRILLAVLIAVVISKPLELKVFDKEIQAELVNMEQEVFAEQEENVRARFTDQGLILQGEVESLKNEIALKQADVDALELAAIQEADGTGGSMQRNLGPIYKAKKAEADKGAEELGSLIAITQPLIDQKLFELDELNSSVATTIEELPREAYNGFAARLDALNRLAASSNPIKIASWFIMFLFIAIETTPVFVKLISPRGPYDDLLDEHEHNYVMTRVEKVSKRNFATMRRLAEDAKDINFMKQQQDLEHGLKQKEAIEKTLIKQQEVVNDWESNGLGTLNFDHKNLKKAKGLL